MQQKDHELLKHDKYCSMLTRNFRSGVLPDGSKNVPFVQKSSVVPINSLKIETKEGYSILNFFLCVCMSELSFSLVHIKALL